jgi:hypothetical protein
MNDTKGIGDEAGGVISTMNAQDVYLDVRVAGERSLGDTVEVRVRLT